MALFRKEMVVAYLRHGVISKGSGCGQLEAWSFFRKEVVVAHLRHGVISKGSGCGRIKYGIVSLEDLR